MDHNMFCFQCEQTAGCSGCTGKAGVCGKNTDVAKLQDELTGALIGLARASDHAPGANDRHLASDDRGIIYHRHKCKLLRKNCKGNDRSGTQGKRTAGAKLLRLYLCVRANRRLCVRKSSGMPRRISAALSRSSSLACAAWQLMRTTLMVLGYTDEEVNHFFAKALFAVGEDWGMDELLPIVMEVGEKNLKCMALLDQANTETYGTPAPVTVPLTVEKGPFIVISGHDLHDLKLLLEQTEGKGINIYTHSEMLPAHGYPELKKYPHLKGNFGTAWQNQQKEFADIPAPILFTTNCLMPPQRKLCGPGIYHRCGFLCRNDPHRRRIRTSHR